MKDRVPLIIKLIPLFLLISTGLQLVIHTLPWYNEALCIYILNFHSYGIWINIFAFYFSIKYCNSIVSDLSILGLIGMNIFSNTVYILNGGKVMTEYNQYLFMMTWDTYIMTFTLSAILCVWYFKILKYKLF